MNRVFNINFMDAVEVNKENEMELKDNLTTVLENCGFSTTGTVYANTHMLCNDKYHVEISQYTPAGEDWIETIWFDGSQKSIVDSVKERVDYFDVDEEAEVWIPHRGTSGVPSSISELVEDAEWKLNELKELLSALQAL